MPDAPPEPKPDQAPNQPDPKLAVEREKRKRDLLRRRQLITGTGLGRAFPTITK